MNVTPFESARLNEMVTLSAAARLRKISRRTVQRYARRFPWILVNGRVEMEFFNEVIAWQKLADGRGFPLGAPRPQRQLRLPRTTKGQRPPRSLARRIEAIRNEIVEMTDEEQKFVFRLAFRLGWVKWFRLRNFAPVPKGRMKLNALGDE